MNNQWLSDQSDGDLVALLQNGSSEQAEIVLSVIYQRYCLDVWRFTLSRVKQRAVSEDVTAGVWLVALQKIWRIDADDLDLRPWLIAIARNKIMEYFREKDVSHLSIDSDEMIRHKALQYIDERFNEDQLGRKPTDADVKLRGELLEWMHRALRILNPTERRVIEMSFFDGLTSSKIAQQLGLKPTTVRQKKRRALNKMRIFVASYG